MKLVLAKSLTLLFCFGVAFSTPDCSAGPRGKKRAAANNNPSASLSTYVENLIPMLELHGAKWVAKAPGDIVVLRSGYVAERVAAKPERQRILDMAVYVCDLLTKALNERRQTSANAGLNKAVKASSTGKGKGKKERVEEIDKLMDKATINYWRNRKSDYINQISAAFTKLQTAEAQTAAAER